MKHLFILILITISRLNLLAQQAHHSVADRNFMHVAMNADIQPVIANAVRVSEALQFIGSALPAPVQHRLQSLQQRRPKDAADSVQALLDPFCLLGLTIDSEMGVSMKQGPAHPVLVRDGWRCFLVKIKNESEFSGRLEMDSKNAGPTLQRASGQHHPLPENVMDTGIINTRFLEMSLYRNSPMNPVLSGLGLEYIILQVYTRDHGRKEAELSCHLVRGTKDIECRNAINVLFDIQKPVKVKFNVIDEDGSPVMASFIVMDKIDRFRESGTGEHYLSDDYRMTWALVDDWEMPGFKGSPEQYDRVLKGAPEFAYDSAISADERLVGVYPLPSKRSAWHDEYPDFYFQPQIYRTNGEHIFLPPGNYTIMYGRGPEYLRQTKHISVPAGADSIVASFQLKRWINLLKLGWFSGDHHIHASGCSHYESPVEGVDPAHMIRQLKGEDLNIGNNLTWGPGWYHQKRFFSGKISPSSDKNNILRYDVEVSGFPSSHAGHLVLLNLTEDDYPGTSSIDEWPTWTLPVLKWGKSQGGLVGYAHSGIGLEPETTTTELPNYVTPKMDGIGANEYIMAVTHGAVDFYSLGNTPPQWELNIWYHTLNSGFRTRISGETDFPCITDERVGKTRVYAKMKKLSFEEYIDAIRKGNTYVSDGYSHLLDLSVNKRLSTDVDSINIDHSQNVEISVTAAAYLPARQSSIGKTVAGRKQYEGPVWNIEKARLGNSRTVEVQLVVNGVAVASRKIVADGKLNNVKFNYPIERSSWVACRIYPSSHTNPFFIQLDGKPVLEEKSVEWCLRALEKCWTMKEKQIRESEKAAARQAYDESRSYYQHLLPMSMQKQ